MRKSFVFYERLLEVENLEVSEKSKKIKNPLNSSSDLDEKELGSVNSDLLNFPTFNSLFLLAFVVYTLLGPSEHFD